MTESPSSGSSPELVSISVQNRLSDLARLSEWLAAEGARLNLRAEDVFRLDIAISELVANTIQYAFDGDETRPIRVELCVEPEKAVLSIEDDGDPFNPFDRPEKVLPEKLEDAEIGGLGIHMVREFADAFDYERRDGKNFTRLSFRTGGASPWLDPAHVSEHCLLQDMPEDVIKSILAEVKTLQLATDEILIRHGEENHNLYLLMAGRLTVHLDSADSDTGFTIEPGECIGEMSVIEKRPTSAWVVAREPSTLLVFTETFFWERFILFEGAVRNLLRILVNRTRNNNEVILKTLEQKLRLEHLQKEAEAAGNIQANILPNKIQLFPNHPQVDTFALMEPAKEVGGDFYDAIALDPERVAIAIGDVSGKGMPAALFMVRVVTLLRMNLIEHDIDRVMPVVNRMVEENNEDTMFATVFFGIFNVRTGRLQYVNAGHNPPFVARAGRPFELLEVPKGILIGVHAAAEYTVAETLLRPGDTLLLYTDGVTEAENPAREQYDEERTADALTQAGTATAADLVGALRADVAKFADGEPPSDDITILALRFTGG